MLKSGITSGIVVASLDLVGTTVEAREINVWGHTFDVQDDPVRPAGLNVEFKAQVGEAHRRRVIPNSETH